MKTSVNHVRLLVFSLALSVHSAPILGQTITQTFVTEADLNDGLLRLTVEPFDSVNSTRTLRSVGVAFDGFLDAEIEFVNYTSSDLGPSDWVFQVGLGLLLVFDKTAAFNEGGPTYELDGFTAGGITGTLSAGTGGLRPPLGNPAPGLVSHFENLSGNVSDEVVSTNLLSYFESDSPLQAGIVPRQITVGSTVEVVDGFIGPQADLLDLNGTLTIRYHWLPTNDESVDCNGDRKVDLNDLRCGESGASLEQVLGENNLLQGDTDGDGRVGFSDFLILSQHFGLPGDYLDGDLDCDGTVAFGDFLILSSNFGLTANPTSHSVPEPCNQQLLLVVVLWLSRAIGADFVHSTRIRF